MNALNYVSSDTSFGVSIFGDKNNKKHPIYV